MASQENKRQKEVSRIDIPFDAFAVTSAVETFDTARSTTSLMSKAMLWSGADPRNGLVISLTPFAR